MIYAFDMYGVTWLDEGFNEPLLAVMRDLRRDGARVVLASNMAADQKTLFRQRPELQAAIDDLLCSGDLGVAKPEAAFYSRVAAVLRIEPEMIMFFDDSAANVEAAKACGWQAHLYADVPSTLKIIADSRK